MTTNIYNTLQSYVCIGWVLSGWSTSSEVGATNMATLQGKPLKGLINGNKLKVYYGPQGSTIT
jgi:hypothetical protein